MINRKRGRGKKAKVSDTITIPEIVRKRSEIIRSGLIRVEGPWKSELGKRLLAVLTPEFYKKCRRDDFYVFSIPPINRGKRKGSRSLKD